MSTPPSNLTCVIDRIESNKVVLIFNIGNNQSQQLILPKKFFPASSKEGDVLTAEFYLENQLASRQKNLARQILKEILKINE